MIDNLGIIVEHWQEFTKLTALTKPQQIAFLLSFIAEEQLSARFEGYLEASEQDFYAGENVI